MSRMIWALSLRLAHAALPYNCFRQRLSTSTTLGSTLSLNCRGNCSSSAGRVERIFDPRDDIDQKSVFLFWTQVKEHKKMLNIHSQWFRGWNEITYGQSAQKVCLLSAHPHRGCLFISSSTACKLANKAHRWGYREPEPCMRLRQNDKIAAGSLECCLCMTPSVPAKVPTGKLWAPDSFLHRHKHGCGNSTDLTELKKNGFMEYFDPEVLSDCRKSHKIDFNTWSFLF